MSANNSKCYLAIDIGASGGRHIIGYLENGRMKTQEVYRFENGMTEKNGHLCWDDEGLVSHVVNGMKACKEQGFAPVSIGIDTWGVDFALLDSNGSAVGDIIAYRDERTKGMDTVLEDSMSYEELYAITGIAKQPFNSLYQMMAVLREHPEYRNEVSDFLFMPEYLSYRLTGKKLHERSEVSTSALMDARSGDWSHDVLKAADLPEHWFCTPIAKPGTALGRLLPEIAEEVGYDATVVLPASHDTGSAYMAIPAKDDNAAFLSSGTWSLFGTELHTPVTNAPSMLAGFTNESGWNGCVRYLKNIMGMWMLQCIRKETDKRHSYAEMAEMAAQSKYSAYINAADNRFLAPASMLEEVKAALAEQGAPAPNDLSDIIRAVTLGLAACYRDSIREMEQLTGRKFTSINIVGGGSQNVTLNQMTADLTGLSVYAGPAEGTALGNLASQMISGGELEGIEQFRSMIKESFEVRLFEPKAR